MAFNPFHNFRKHSKVLFAILTIICMFTFVLSFGKGDFFEWLTRAIGGGRNRGEAVATLYGDTVYTSQIDERAHLRRLANNALRQATLSAFLATASEVIDILNGPEPGLDNQNRGLSLSFRNEAAETLIADMGADRGLEELVRPLFSKLLALPQQEGKKPEDNSQFQARFARFQAWSTRVSQGFGVFPEQRRGYLRMKADRLKYIQKELSKAGADKEAELAGQLAAQQAFFAWLAGGTARHELPFGDSTRRQDLLDFLMWLHQADRLGVQLTRDAVRKAIQQITGRDMLADDAAATALLPAEKGMRADVPTLYRALGDELRVGLAKGTILGEEPGVLGNTRNPFVTAGAVSPAEYLVYFREQRTTIGQADLLTVPVEAFLDQVKENPSQSDLEELFRRYRNEEPRPWSMYPGFKQPRRVGLEWVVTENIPREKFIQMARVLPLGAYLRGLSDPREQYYLDRALDIIGSQVSNSELETAGKELPGATLPLPTPVPSLLPRPVDPRLLPQLAELLNVRDRLNRSYSDKKIKFPVPSLLAGAPALAYYTALNLPTYQASTAALLVAGPLQAGPLNTIAAYQTTAFLRGRELQAKPLKLEVQHRALVAAAATLPMIGRLPALGRPAAWILANDREGYLTHEGAETRQQEPLLNPYASLGALRYQVREDASSGLARVLQKKSLEPLEKALTRESTGTEEKKVDPEKVKKSLEELKKKYPWWDLYHGKTEGTVDARTVLTSPELAPVRQAFGAGPALTEKNFRALEPLFSGKSSDVYQQQTSGGVLYWKTANLPATTPPDLAAVRDQVVRAWKMQEARKLARQAAQEIRDRVAGKSPEEAQKIFREIRGKHPSWNPVIQLKDVALQVAPKDTQQRFAATFELFQVPATVPYPTADFVTELLQLQQHQAGVMEDSPRKHFYVAYVEKRPEPPSVKQAADERDGLWRALENQQEEELRQKIVKELRRQAGELNAEGRFVLRPGVKDDRESGVAQE
jgi:hypothetical protein